MAPLGPVVRRLLGARLARSAGGWYRSIFVDLRKEAAAIATVIPLNAHLLDIGGGDGDPLNYLLAIRPDLRITTLDPGPLAGQWIEECFESRVTRLPRTSLEKYLADGRADPDAILIADVMHHIPSALRPSFLASISLLLERVPRLRIVIKDVEPGSWRALLGYWSDRYITGDRDVDPVSRKHAVRLFEESMGPLHHEETDLFDRDSPNYAIALFR